MKIKALLSYCQSRFGELESLQDTGYTGFLYCLYLNCRESWIFVINKVWPILCIGSFLRGAKISTLPLEWCSVPVCSLCCCVCTCPCALCVPDSALSGDSSQSCLWGRENVSISGCWSEGCTCCCPKVWFSMVLCSWKCWCLAIFGQCEVNNTAWSFFACLTEMGVMPEIAQAVEEMDWL